MFGTQLNNSQIITYYEDFYKEKNPKKHGSLLIKMQKSGIHDNKVLCLLKC